MLLLRCGAKMKQITCLKKESTVFLRKRRRIDLILQSSYLTEKKMAARTLASLFVFFLIMSCSSSDTGPLRIDGSNGVRPLMEAVVSSYQTDDPEQEIEVGEGMPSSERLAALDKGEIDLIMASHGLDADELRVKGYDVYRFAQMPVVIAINTEENGLSALTSQELCGIYTGEYKNWSELRGPNMPIQPFARPRAEVDMEVLEANLTCFNDLAMDENVEMKERSGELARALMQTPGAIGMTTMTRVVESDGKLRALTLHGIRPSYGHMSDGSYQLMRDAFLVARPNASQKVKDFLAFVEGDGAEVIMKKRALPIDRKEF